MNEKSNTEQDITDGSSLNVGVVGGGKTCKLFLELINSNRFPYPKINVVGVCDLNPKAEGYKLAEALGLFTTKDYRELFRIENLDGVFELTNKREVLLELIKRRPKGVWVLEHNIGRLFRELFNLEEIVKEKERDAALEKMVSDILLHHTRERIVLLGPDFRILDANDAYLEAVKISRAKAIGGRCYEIIYGFSSPCSEWQPELRCPMLETIRTGKSAHVIHEYTTEGDQIAYCDLETFPVKNDSGEVVRVIEIRRDLTEEISSRMELRLEQLKTNLGKLVEEDRMLSLGKLSASCAHEINNPIQGLLTFAHLMKSILDEEKATADNIAQFKEYVSMMSHELERCGNIVSGLLSFAREKPMETRKIDLNEILEALISLTRHKMELQDIALVLELNETPLYIHGDVSQMHQCLLNLIFNAIEAMPGGGRLTVSSDLDLVQRCARIIVSDTGCGIPEEIKNKIFEPFFTTKDQGEGTGLGLSIVYGIVKSHRGTIEVKSDVDKGATFAVSFPLAKDEE